MPSITPLGKRWERLHSIWLIWLIFIYKHGYLSFIAFFYIGIRAKKRKWIIAGFIYLLGELGFLIMSYLDSVKGWDDIYFDWTVAVFLFFCIVSWVHAFWVRREYLLVIAEKEIVKRKQKRSKDTEKNIQQTISTASQQKAMEAATTYHQGPIPINTAKKADIAAITGMELATKITDKRAMNGHFHSLTDLIRSIHIKPHVLVQIQKHFIFDQKEMKQPDENKTTSSTSQGRMVDY